LGFLFIWLTQRGIPIGKIQTLKFPFILFFLALLISIIFSIEKINSLKELYKYVSGILIFLTAISLNYEDRIRIVKVIILSGFLISLLAIYQYFFGFRHILDYLAKERITVSSFTLDYIQTGRVFFPFVTPNTLAGYLIMIIPLALTHKNKIWFIIPLSFALLLTKSLSALLSLLLSLGVYFYLSRLCAQEQDLKCKLERKKVIFLFGLLIIIGLVFMARSTTQKQHLKPIFSTVMRLNYWKDTLSVIKTKPLTGLGIGNFNLKLSRYAHNSYLQIWAEAGILGITSFLWLLTYILKSALKNIKVSLHRNQTTAIFAATAVFLIHNFLDFTFFLPEVSLLWWMILGLIL